MSIENINYNDFDCEKRRCTCRSCSPAPCPPKPIRCCCVGPKGDAGAQGPKGDKGDKGDAGEQRPVLSSYIEALANGQTVASNANIIFDVGSIDDVGGDIVLDSSGQVFTINRTGLYHIEWDVNLAADSNLPAVIGIIENGEPASGSASSTAGNFSSGTLIWVDTVPFTISLFNFAEEITLEHPTQWENSAASIRILRFADGPNV